MDTATSTMATPIITQLTEGELIQLQYIQKILASDSKELAELFPLVGKRIETKKVKGKKERAIEVLEIHGYFSFNLLLAVSESAVSAVNNWEITANFKNNETWTFCFRFERPIIHVV